MIHHRTHPTPVDGCDACRWASVSISATAMPTRKPELVAHGEWTHAMDRDMGAYKTMRNEGLQPKGVQGSHRAMMTSNTAEEAQGLPKLWGRRDEILADIVPDMGVKDAP